MSTQRWRVETIPSPIICKACAQDCASHYMHPVGLDKLGRPVIYSVFNMVWDWMGSLGDGRTTGCCWLHPT